MITIASCIALSALIGSVISYLTAKNGCYKQLAKLEDEIRALKRFSMRFQDYTYCTTCRGLFAQSYMQAVKVQPVDAWAPITTYYCQAHKMPYDAVIGGEYFRSNVPVTQEGTIIK